MIYQQGDTIPLLFHILNTTTEAVVARYAIVGLPICLRNVGYEHMDLPQRTEIFQMLMPLMLHRDAYVRTYIRGTVQSSIKTEFLPAIHGFIQESLASDNPWHLHAALYMASMCIGYSIECIGPLMQVGKAMIEKGMQCEIIDVNVATARWALNIALYSEEGDPIGPASMAYSMSILTRLITEFPAAPPEQQVQMLGFIEEICKILCVVVDDGEAWFLNPLELMSYLLQILSSPIDCRIKREIHVVCDIIITSYSEVVISNPEVVKSILTVYFGLAMEAFQAEDPFDLADHNIFSAMCPTFAESDEILGLLLSMVEQMFATPPGKYAMITALYYSLSVGADFFQDKIKPMSELLAQGLQDGAYCTREAAAVAIAELANSQMSEIASVANDLIVVLLRVMTVNMSSVFIRAVTAIVRNVYEDIGPIFNDLLNEVVKYLEAPDPDLVSSAFQCISELVHKSPKRARQRFADIFQVMQKPLETAGVLDELKPSAVYCISGLLKASKKLFMPHAQTFVTIILQNFMSPDTSLVHESIIAFGNILQNIPDVVAPVAEEVLNKLIEVGSRDISVSLEDEDMLGIDDDDEEGKNELERQVDVVAAAIRIACCTVSIYPELLARYIGPVTGVIQKAFASSVSDYLVSCGDGAVFIVEGLQKIGFTEEVKSYVVQLVKILAEIASSDNASAQGAGKAFTAIADIIAVEEQTGFVLCTGSMEMILGAINDVFTGQRMYMEGTLTFDEELHRPAQRILREIMASIGAKAIPIIQNFVPLMNELVVNFKKNAMKDIALEFFGDLVYWCGDGLPDDIKTNTFILAMNAVEIRNSAYGFGIFKQLAEKAPQVMVPSLAAVLQAIKNRLSTDESSESAMMSQDNCVGALYMIAKFMGDQFPLADFVGPIVAHMPPQVLTDEYNDSVEFLKLLMGAVPAGQCVTEFAGALVRLFADGLETLANDYGLSQENIAWARQALVAILPAQNAPQFIAEVCEGDEFKCEAVVEAMSM